MPCKPLHAVHYLHWADLNSMHCSHVTSWSIQLKPNSLGWHYALLHQSAYQQHLGLLLGTFINGSSLARSYRRHLRATQSSDPHWSATWTPSTLDWRPRIWDLEWNSGFGQSKSTVHYAHELPPGTSKPKHATVTHCRQKECPAGCILFLQAVFLSFSLFALLMFLLVFWLKSRSWLAGIDAPRVPMSVPRRHFAIRLQHGSGAASLRRLLHHLPLPSDMNIHEPSSRTWWNRNECGSSSLQLYGDDPSCSFTTWIYIRPPRGGISITIGNATKSSDASHSHFQGGNVASRVRPSQSPNGDGGWPLWSWTEPSTGIGHVRSYDGGNINSWDQATRLANYWRRYYNVPEAHGEDTSWTSSWQNYQRSSDNADNATGSHEEQPESDMDDVTSVTAETGNVPIPSQIHRQGLKTCGTVERALLQPADSKRCKL